MATTLPFLTAARRSLWDAINNWPAFKRNPADVNATFFARRITLDDPTDGTRGIEPGVGDLPAIAIVPTQVTPAWWLNQGMKFGSLLQIQAWLSDWDLSKGEKLVQDLVEAFFQCCPPGSTVPYVKAAVGYHPTVTGPASFLTTFLGADPIARSAANSGQSQASQANQGPRQKVLVVRFMVTLTPVQNPFQ